MTVIPTIFAHNKKEFEERFKKLLPISKNIQIDFMDGKFVKAKSVQLKNLPNLKKFKNNFEAHLMVSNPEKYLPELKKKGFKKIIFHIEATKYPDKIIEKIKKLKMKPMAAINPKTNILKLPRNTDVLFMGVIPGKEHQKFMPSVYNKIKAIRRTSKKIKIQVDGGVSHKNISKLKKLGVNSVNTGSYVSEANDPKTAFKKINAAFR